MAWDRLEPQDTTKIRNLGTVIRPNFQAIDSGDSSFKPIALNYSDRDTDPLAATSDPAAIAATYILYCKQDTGGDPELFGIDASSNIIQFTNGAPTLATSGKVFLPGGILVQWNRESVTSGNNVTFPTAFSAAAYFVGFHPTGTSGTNRILYRLSGNPTATQFSPIITKQDNTGLTETIYWVAIGPA